MFLKSLVSNSVSSLVPKEDIMIQDFLSKYDKNSNLKFDSCRFRPSASFSTDFGLDDTFKTLRLHPAIDRGYSRTTTYDIFAPFDFEKVTYTNPYLNFGSMLFLPVLGADFELRIAHMAIDDVSPYYRTQVKNGVPFTIKANDKIGEAGNLGISVGSEIVKGKAGAHTHTEVVSLGESSKILDYILEQKLTKAQIKMPYSDNDILDYALRKGLNVEEVRKTYTSEIKRRNILFINNFKCIRVDYYSNTVRTFYNSRILFEF